MSMIICGECGKEFSDKAPACPNCGCPIVYNQSFQYQQLNNQQNSYQENCDQQYQNYQQGYNKQFYMQNQYGVKQKDSVLSIIAAVFSLFLITSFVGFILAIIDLAQNDKRTRHLGSYFSIVFFIICCFGFMLLRK
jgi:uncharacterized membrane protein YvbJ